MEGNNIIFQPVKNRELLSKLVASNIEEAIRTKKILTGTKLPSELELCSQFGVSRTAVREALRTLIAKGLISIIKGKGIFVCESSPDIISDQMQLYLQRNSKREYVLEVIHARQIIEPTIASYAAKFHTDDDIKKLQLDIEELHECNSGYSQLTQLDLRFHLNIAKAAQNHLVQLMLDPIFKLMPEIKASVYATISDAKESALIWHKNIFDAIKEGNPDNAQKMMKKHLEIAESHIIKMLTIQNEAGDTQNENK